MNKTAGVSMMLPPASVQLTQALKAQADYQKLKTSNHNVVHHSVKIRCALTDADIGFGCSGACFYQNATRDRRIAKTWQNTTGLVGCCCDVQIVSAMS